MTTARTSPEGIDVPSVSAWLAEHVDGAVPPFEFSLIAGGHSNLTYLALAGDGAKRVVRRPPLGHVLATAHDMGREHRIISGVGRTDVPVPAAVGLCEDVEVNGAPFYVMDFVEGDVVANDEVVRERVPPGERVPIGLHVAEVLAALHSVEPDDVGLGELGRRDSYIERQLKRWSRQWEASKTRELPEMDECQRILAARMPEQVGSGIVHGDYRLGNMICAGGRVQAVLDWELCTLGDPLADVGYLMNNWIEPGEAAPSTSAPTGAGGFPSREEVLVPLPGPDRAGRRRRRLLPGLPALAARRHRGGRLPPVRRGGHGRHRGGPDRVQGAGGVPGRGVPPAPDRVASSPS